MSFLQSPYVRVLTLVLCIQGVIYYTVALRAEHIPVTEPLSTFPYACGGWQLVRDLPLDQETQDVLKADDTLNRIYANPSRPEQASLFIAFFKTQRSGQAPHSPKNCLPGNGWAPISSGYFSIPVPGRPTPIVSNKYVVQLGDEKDVVIYWYQSHRRIIASEYSAKFWLVADAIRYHRSDAALVKIVIPVVNGNIDSATQTGIEFVQSIFPDLHKHLPA
jgi:EpsI family protein